MNPSERPSAWRTAFAHRTYVSGLLWMMGLVLSRLTNEPDPGAWLPVRLDATGLMFLAASVVGGMNFFGAALRAARSLKLDMNFLMAAALIGAVVIGEPFEAATLAFLFSAAELLERLAMDRGRRSIARLVELAPEEALQLRDGGEVDTVRADALRVGDRVRIRPGGKIPADGRVIAGASAVNEATITGESFPREKRVGDDVFAGTLNTDGILDIEVSADAQHSTLARIVQLVRDAETQRAPIERFVKRFARVYTPVVTVLAVLVMILPPLVSGADGHGWFVRGLTLLVIACPCALVIATPVTVMSALTSAARHGVLIKGGEHLEALGGITALAIDKTGTLTTGRLRVTDVRVTGGPEHTLLRLVAAVESRSEHPVARAIGRFAEERAVSADAPVANFVAVAGRGVRAMVDDQELVVGIESYVGAAPDDWEASPKPGTTQVFARAGETLRGVFTVRDEVRPTAPRIIADLHALGVRPIVMLTGDAEAAAASVGQAVGVDDIQARLLPEHKVEAVRALRERFGAVAMLGDGVNDAPALTAATVGLAMGAAGSAAAIETADIVLMADDLARLPYAIRLARRSRNTVRFNIGLALGLKLLLAVGTVAGVVSLAVAVLLGDMGGSLVVTANALRLARVRGSDA